jgi:hypothetical protein
MQRTQHDTNQLQRLDREHGSYGRGVYAGHSIYNQDYDTPGSYGRGMYAWQNTHDVDFHSRASYAREMRQAGAD